MPTAAGTFKRTLACQDHWQSKDFGDRASIMEVAMKFFKRQTAKLHNRGYIGSWWGWIRRFIGSQVAAVRLMLTRTSIVVILLSVLVLQSAKVIV